MLKKTNSTYGEQLLSRPAAGVVGFDVIVRDLPTFEAYEIVQAYNSSMSSNNYSHVSLNFNNLINLDIKKILIYYAPNTLGAVVPSTLWELQEHELFAEYTLLAASTEHFSIVKQILLPVKNSSVFSFYAVYLDSNNNAVNYLNKPIINYAVNVLFAEATSYDVILGAKNVTTANVNIIDNLDLEGGGFVIPYNFKGNTIDLMCLDHSLLNDPNVFAQYENSAYFYDTYNNTYELVYSDFLKIEYYVVYKFISFKGDPPQYRYPQQISTAGTLDPMVNDINGSWRLIGKFATNRFSVPVEDGHRYGFWVGIKLGK